jgi:hypothetical protein
MTLDEGCDDDAGAATSSVGEFAEKQLAGPLFVIQGM